MKDQNMVIRPYDAATDTKILSGIWLDASRIAHPFIGEARLLEQRHMVEDVYLPNAETWVACGPVGPVGFISLMDSFIGAIFVAPDQQGHGVGRILIDHALLLKGTLALDVYTRNEQAMRFYQRLGFIELSRRPEDDEGMPFENAHLQLTR
ncbi:GNAT family N-acetyltransferase [Paracoccus xiamenensis]|uniref:GNAT family N-acetyltransferase n=1 Tax=Paracoccus xiamenensis TaxID=2714901 RepID=UPI0014099D89|nr:GNAT family N-acetyltransferase [Paracoccus xiamenensis]NHF74601.1 GNAT family N-acetyltransferase [Paracoccus xiamenensis]